jgi:hypothetical protein
VSALFLAFLDPNGSWTFQTFADRKDGEKLDRVLHGPLSEHGETLTRLNERDAGVFVTVNETNGRGRKADNIVRVRALFADADGPPLDVLGTSPLPPHIVVESSPGRWHAYWRVDGLPLEEFESVQRAIAARFGTDGSVNDLSRVMRLPGFLHRKGEPFRTRILEAREMSPYSAEAIRRAFGAAEAKPKEPPAGERITKDRNVALTAFAGKLRRAGMALDVMAIALRAYNNARCDPPLPEREIDHIVKSAESWDPEIAEMNAEFAVTWAGAQGVILREYHDAELGRRTVCFVKPSDLALVLANRTVQVGKKLVPLFDWWRGHALRRQYTQVLFAPGRTVPDAFNLWRGWAVKADPNASCGLFLAHLRDVICAGDEGHYRWVMAWLADAVQNPDTKPGTALVLRGREGTGKGSFAQYVGRMYGEHFVHLTHAQHLVGRFNAHMKGCALCFADEAFFAGDRAHEGVLKALITEPTVMLEMKFVNAFPVANRIRLILASNSDWVVPAGLTARRFCCLDVPDTHAEDHAYFAALNEEMENGGPAALMHHLLGLDISGVNLRESPKTAMLLEQKQQSMTPVARFWFERLMDGELVPGIDETSDLLSCWTAPEDDGRAWVAKDALYDAYIRHAQTVNDRFRDAPESFGVKLTKLCPEVNKNRKKMVPVWATDPTTGKRYRTMKYKNAYGFPDLVRCRELFEKAIGQPVDWPWDTDEDGQCPLI